MGCTVQNHSSLFNLPYRDEEVNLQALKVNKEVLVVSTLVYYGASNHWNGTLKWNIGKENGMEQ